MTSWPMAPAPTMPTVRPSSSGMSSPLGKSLSHTCSIIAAWVRAMLRVSARISPTANSATARALRPGVLTTRIPRAWAA